MNPAFLIKLNPAGAWRFGPGEGGREAVDHLYRSDRLFSAVTIAMKHLGRLTEWLSATVEAERPAVVFSSLFPFQADTLFATPPASVWPPPPGAVRVSSPVFATKVRWRDARFVPLGLIETLLMSQRVLADQWVTDPDSACLLRRDRPQSSPYRLAMRTQTAVDRLTRKGEPHSSACLEFEPGAGLWSIASFADESAKTEWGDSIKAAFRLLADTGFGGRRSTGWGQVSKVDISDGQWPALLLPKLARTKTASIYQASNGVAQHWLLSLFTPATGDNIDWSQGNYSMQSRGGFIESANGAGSAKKLARMIVEGSVVASTDPIRGAAVNVAPDGAEHPSYRAGFALALKMPVIDYSAVVEEPVPESAELQEALTEALRSAAEEDVTSIAVETAEHAVEEFREAEAELQQQLEETAPDAISETPDEALEVAQQLEAGAQPEQPKQEDSGNEV